MRAKRPEVETFDGRPVMAYFMACHGCGESYTDFLPRGEEPAEPCFYCGSYDVGQQFEEEVPHTQLRLL